ncbi:MAG: hypothetical protein HY781_02840 [Chloroflexi bacterium]|nr:hypothetical protein [Chloroflexota bacterium]
MRTRLLVGGILLILTTQACGASAPSLASTPAADGTQFGVAGLIPRNFPHPSAADWTNLYETLPETGSLLGVYTSWSDSSETAGEIPSVVSAAYGLADRYDFIPVVVLGFFNDMPDGSLQASIQLSDPAERLLFQQTALAIVEKYQPPYLGLGGEVNRYHEAAPSDFDNYLTLYAETYDAVKSVSPQTKVFAVFQLEMLKGNGYLLGNSEKRQPQWGLLSRFGDRLDLAAFTTYPFLDFQSPDNVPADYYAEIAAHTGKPVAFTEIGWPSAPLTPFPDSPYGGSEDEQAEFIRRFFDLTSGLDLALALWSFPHDLGEGGHPAFDSVSLRNNNGDPKPALVVWQDLSRGK